MSRGTTQRAPAVTMTEAQLQTAVLKTAKRKRIYTRGTAVERARAHVRIDIATGCWNWVGAKASGYGHMNIGGNKFRAAHIVLYEDAYGQVPAGLELDHLCRNRGCVNPDHLEPVTRRENALRTGTPLMQAHLEGRCVRGHPASEACRRKSNGRVVYCRACRRENRAAKK